MKRRVLFVMGEIPTPSAFRARVVWLGCLLAALAVGGTLHAQTWDGGGTNDNWTTATNWVGDAAPLNNGTANVIMAGNVRLTPNLNAPAPDILSLTFNNTAGAFNFNGVGMTVRSGGIINNAANTQTFNNGALNPANSTTQTWNAASGSLSILGQVNFSGVSSLSIDGGFNTTINGVISGNGTLTKNGTGTLTFGGNNTWVLQFTINAGTATISANERLAAGLDVTVNSPGTLNLAGFTESFDALSGNGSVTLGAGSLNAGTGGSGGTFSGVISGTGGNFTKSGAGTITLSGANIYTGTTFVNAGTLQIGASERLADTSTLTIGGGTFDLQSFNETVNVVTLTSGSIIGTGTLINPGSFTLNGGLFGSTLINQGSATQNGGTFSGTLTNQSSFTLVGGTNSSALINLGSAIQNGGTFNGTLINQGVFTYNGGVFAGRLVNYNTFNSASGNFTAGNGVANLGTMPLTNGQTYTFNGQGFDNQGTLTLANATLTGTGPLVNNSSLSGFGTIGGSGGFTNHALWTLSGGNLNLDNTGVNANFGNLDLASGQQLRLNGGPLFNGGSINLNSGIITGTATLTNGAGGTLAGRGTIACPFNNAGGMVLLDSGTLNISQNFSSSGTIQLTSAAANLAGGAIANTGTIQGLGSIGNALNNSGTVEAIGGTLTFGGSVNNSANGLMAALSGAKILVSSGLANSAGIISLSGGTFDNNGRALNNTGQISGYGTLRSGGLANNGSVTFSGGFTTINGNVTNQATRTIRVSYNPAIFTGTVVNNGTFKVTSTTAQFTGTYIENGTFTSDPATNLFAGVIIGTAGRFVGGAGDLFSVSGNLSNGSLQNLLWDTAGAELVFKSGAAHTFALAGADAGPTRSGYNTNFAWKTFRLGSGEALSLADGNPASGGGALYTKRLILESGLPQISSILGNGLNIYYDPLESANAYLAGGTYPLGGGGAIIPVTTPGYPNPVAHAAAQPPLAIVVQRRAELRALSPGFDEPHVVGDDWQRDGRRQRKLPV